MSKKHQSLRGAPQCKVREIRRSALGASVGKVLRPQFEPLEPRHLLAANPWAWFESFDEVPRLRGEQIAAQATSPSEELSQDRMGPHPLVASEWIAGLTTSVTEQLSSVSAIDDWFDRATVDMTVISGLGTRGLLLLRGEGVTIEDVESVLASDDRIESFSLNSLVQGQATVPNDPEFSGGLLPGLERVSASEAWDESIGSSQTVVGVVDSGIDATHPDLFLNVWLNQGEIPAAFREQLVDIDNDQLITFYDLNNLQRTASGIVIASTGHPASVAQMTTATPFDSGPNADFVEDRNLNGRIDVVDLLEDVSWADGRDTDGNTFFDDLFGVNFRAGNDDPFPSNRPLDPLGHGTHVAGTIGAVGDNGFGVTGLNWQTSLMSLRILDNNNQSDAAAAIRAINYARAMRADLTIGDDGRVERGAGVRVLNNSWGQPGGFEQAFETAIDALGDEGILFVAAAGNGNLLGNGVDNDSVPFFPASYDVDNVIAVSALSASGNALATFSNYGSDSADIAAPGVGVRSTLPGGVFAPANGTSMATPHVSATAALIWSALPSASVAEIREAILGSAEAFPGGSSVVSSGGRLESAAAIKANVFTPTARLVSRQSIKTSGGASTEFVVEFDHRDGIDLSTIGDGSIEVTRSWGPADSPDVALKPSSILQNGTKVQATFVASAPGGTWDALDFGDYRITTVPGIIQDSTANQSIALLELGSFNVRIEDDPSVLYIDSFSDTPGGGSLREAIATANASVNPMTIILEEGRYTIDIPHQPDPDSTYPYPDPDLFIASIENNTGWSDETTGDFDITGDITIIGSLNDFTVIDAQSFDRVFKVHPGGALDLARVTVTGGVSPPDQGGGGILSAGSLTVTDSNVQGNVALGVSATRPIRGGGIAVWDGVAEIRRTWIDENESNFGGGIFFGGVAEGIISQSALTNNEGGGLHSHSDRDLNVDSTTFSANHGGQGAIYNGKRDISGIGDTNSYDPVISGDGRYIAFATQASALIGVDAPPFRSQVLLYDRLSGLFERISQSDSGVAGDGSSFDPAINDDGRYVSFSSSASNLFPDFGQDYEIVVNDRQTADLLPIGPPIETTSMGSDSFLTSDGSRLVYNVQTSQGSTFSAIHTISNSRHRPLPGLDPAISGDGTVYATRNPDNSSIVVRGVETDEWILEVQSNGTDFRAPSLDDSGSTLVSLDQDGYEVAIFEIASGAQEETSLPDPTELSDQLTSLSISGNGRFLVFASSADNLVAEDTNQASDIFVYDRQTQTVERINMSASGEQANGSSDTPSISDDGRFVTFLSSAVNLVANDSNGAQDIFVVDRELGTIESPTIFAPTISQIHASHVTIAQTSGSRYAVAGDVRVENSLVTANEVLDIDSNHVNSTNSLTSDDLGSERFSSLERRGSAPPAHLLLGLHPGIDAATADSQGTIDQFGTARGDGDLGAVEAKIGSARGTIYFDSNQNQVQDRFEPGVANFPVSASGSAIGNLQLQTSRDDPSTPLVDENGRFDFGDVSPGYLEVDVEGDGRWRLSEAEISRLTLGGEQLDQGASAPVVNFDASIVVFKSTERNLHPYLTFLETQFVFNTGSLFHYDREQNLVKLVALGTTRQSNGAEVEVLHPDVSDDGQIVVFERYGSIEGQRSIRLVDVSMVPPDASPNSFEVEVGLGIEPSISGDGRFVVYSERFGGGVYLFDRSTGLTDLISRDIEGDPANGGEAKISKDGTYVVFTSYDGLVAEDTNGLSDVYVFNRETGTIERVSSADGQEAGDHGTQPSISRDGRYVSFLSGSTGAPLAPRLYVFDRETDQLSLVSQGVGGGGINGPIRNQTISPNAQYVAFASYADNLVPSDLNASVDLFVHDLTTGQTKIASVAANGTQSDAHNSFFTTASFTNDGRTIAFESYASNLVVDDVNDKLDVFFAPNPLDGFTVGRFVSPGERIEDFNIGLLPNPGSISGQLYEDSVANGIFDQGERLFTNWTVFLDENANGQLDEGEISTLSQADGTYQFDSVPAYRDHIIGVDAPASWEQIAPGENDNFAWKIFLPAGGEVAGRDFAFRRVSGTGQSSSSAVSGRLFEDNNGNEVYDPGIDSPLANAVVYLDQANRGVRDPNEPAVETAADGSYRIDHLGASVVAVSTLLDGDFVHQAPLGNAFDLETYPLFDQIRPFGNPQSIIHADFNADGFPDIAVALAEANQISIRLNDQHGGFSSQKIDVDLAASGGGPVSIIAGQFNGTDTAIDLAVVNNFSSNVTIFTDFNGAGFDSLSNVAVGQEPIDLVAAPVSGDVGASDLVVVNKADRSIQILSNDGDGAFSAGQPIPTGGIDPVAIVAGDLTGDASLDVAVVHATPSGSTPFGDVRILEGNSAGELSLTPAVYEVGAFPADLVVADFDGDASNRLDLAVTNFASNSISILTNNGDGSFTLQDQTLGTSSGALDLAVADIDNDNDMDLVASNLLDRNISIFRNITVTPGTTSFQPLEGIGLGQVALAQRMPLTLANFDQDTSGPGGRGTIDIVAVPRLTDTLHVLSNQLVNGAHRVQLTGLNQVAGLDFSVKPALLPPRFDPIAALLPVLEDAGEQSVSISGIAKGRADGPELQFTVTSDNPSLIPSPGLLSFAGGTSTSFLYAPVPDSNGIAVLTVRATDAGADGVFGGEDDGIFERLFTVTVLPVNDPPVFELTAEASAKQDDGEMTVTGFLTGIGNGGGADEDSQTRDPLVVTASDPSFFTTQPTIDAAGTLTFTPNPNRSGSVPVTVTLKDSGGRVNGGVDTTTQSFLVTVLPVNDPPSFTLMANPNQSVLQTAGPQTVNDFVASFLPGGGPDEASQTVSDYIVSVDTPGIFSVLPDLSNSGVLTFTPAIDRSGVATVSVQVRDSGGQANGGNDLSATQTFVISVEEIPDTTPPMPVLSTPGIDSLTNQTTFTVDVDFGEPVTDFTLHDVTVSSGTTSAFSDHGGGMFSFHYSGSDGSVTFGIAADVAADLSGNSNVASQPWTRTIDSQGMTPTLSSTEPNPSNAASFVVAIDFTEAATGFTLSDLTVLGGTASNLIAIDETTGKYDVTITPSADGIVTVILPANSARDTAGNGNMTGLPLARTVDKTAPIAALSTNQPALTNQASFNVIADFGEAIIGLQQSSLVVSGGEVGELQMISDQRYSWTITAANGTVEISLPADSVTDDAGNSNANSNTISLTVDTSTIVPLLATTAPLIVTDDTFDISIDFGKAVLGFDINDVLVSHAIAGDLVVVDESVGKYAATITPVSDGVVNVTVPAAAAMDVAGNANEASNSITRQIDRIAPSATLAFLASSPGQTSREVEIAFSEAVSGFEPDDLEVSGGTVGSLVRNLNDTVYRVLVNPTADGDLTVDLPADRVQDFAGLGNTAATTIVTTVDISQPTPTIAAAPSTMVGDYEIVITFDESVTGLSVNDFQVSNGILSNLSGDADEYTATVTALIEGDVTISLPEERVVDSAGNRNIESNILRLTHRYVDSIVLQGDGEVVDMTAYDETILSTVETIDIRGAGDNSIVLDVEKITRLTPNQTLMVIANRGDAVTFDDGWTFDSVQIVDEMLQRVFTNGPATIVLIGPDGWTHPILSTDVDGNGSVTPIDALRVINALERGQVFDDAGVLVDPATADPNAFAFYDVNGDLRLTTLDALIVINELARLESESEGEQVAVSFIHPLPWAGDGEPIADIEDRGGHITQIKSELLSGENAEESMPASDRFGDSLSESIYSGDVERTMDDDRSNALKPIDQALEVVQVWHDLDRSGGRGSR
ncbi:hypothetical protein CKO51_06060 [Rhodopirellula sp. SM50]|nr:Ig-like domain-containing protein [Rhodopirellula sp. SM50]PAY20398.1 hypothetical protein CKO51_06060 [Rhodopirellula sp. SM50]